MIRRPPRSTRTATLFPYTTLFRSLRQAQHERLGLLQLARIERGGVVEQFGRMREHGVGRGDQTALHQRRSEEHTSELQSLMRISYAVFCLKKKNNTKVTHTTKTRKIQKSKITNKNTSKETAR